MEVQVLEVKGWLAHCFTVGKIYKFYDFRIFDDSGMDQYPNFIINKEGNYEGFFGALIAKKVKKRKETI